MEITKASLKSDILAEGETPYDSLLTSLLEFGLTQNQARVYLFLSKNTSKSAPDISKSLKIARTETYHLLNGLQSKGITIAAFGKPTKFQAVPFDKSINILVNNERSRIDELEKQTLYMISQWNLIPDTETAEALIKENRFQIVQGKVSIVGKLNQLINSAKKDVLLLGSEKDFMKFYHTDFIDSVKDTNINIKILMSTNNNAPYIVDELPANCIKKFEDSLGENLWFLIKDCEEIFFFIKNSENEEMLAVWTDSKTMLNSMKLLFNMIWKKAEMFENSQ
ncbi:MAG: TrmB family transcriptional regulator [Thaumarchaeota archaeon]|jgi:sugar-specific transcriptional regulator TrmB|nr:TrmB family transcriptional regulator [Nitrososphaerota archaeon]